MVLSHGWVLHNGNVDIHWEMIVAYDCWMTMSLTIMSTKDTIIYLHLKRLSSKALLKQAGIFSITHAT